jgi:hypothetical protein
VNGAVLRCSGCRYFSLQGRFVLNKLNSIFVKGAISPE